MARSGRFTEITRDHLLPKLIHPARLKDTALVQTILDMAEATGPAAFIRQETALLDRDDHTPMLSEIRCPTLVMVGEADAITPVPMVRAMAEKIPGARSEIIADSGHLTTLERPAETTALLREWLALTSPSLLHPPRSPLTLLIPPRPPKGGEGRGEGASVFSAAVDRRDRVFTSPAPSLLVASTPSPQPSPPFGGRGR